MIRIQERINKQVPGETSFYISFEYDRDVVATVKSLPSASFNKKTTEWEIPISSLSEAIDTLCPLDDLQIDLIKYQERKDKKFKLSKYKTTPFDYQLDGIQYGLNHDKWLLLDSPGLGKTLQLIYLAQELKNRNKIEKCLIICGINTLKTNWKKEIQKHSDLSCMILGERVNTKGRTVFEGVPYRLNQLNNKIILYQ